MRIELPSQLEAYIQYKIHTGLYSNGAEVIRDALRHMMTEDEEAENALRLKVAVHEGFAQIEEGLVHPFTDTTMQELMQEARQRAQQGKTPKAEVVS
jgi:putative addiction module CopG family antidote